MFKRIILIVMDSVGIGHAPDAFQFGDVGANTLGNIDKRTPIRCKTLKSLGLANIADIQAYDGTIQGMYGRMIEQSAGKDTTSGHWELMGYPVTEPFPTFYDGFPPELLDKFTVETGYGYLGNEVASGTEIIERLGKEHLLTGRPIIYTSADSVLQIAAHEEIISLQELYRICKIVRNKVCIGPYNVGRIIARPFIGKIGSFERTANRHDYSRMPETTLYHEVLKNHGYQTIGIGKIGDIYAHLGLTASYPTLSNAHGMMKAAELLGGSFTNGLMMINLVEFDSLYGHRRNIIGYKYAIEEFDALLKGFLPLLNKNDLLLITADHGNDPTWKGTDHTREIVPLLGYYGGMNKAIPLGDRQSFADIGQTILDNFNCPLGPYGSSFLNDIK